MKIYIKMFRFICIWFFFQINQKNFQIVLKCLKIVQKNYLFKKNNQKKLFKKKLIEKCFENLHKNV